MVRASALNGPGWSADHRGRGSIFPPARDSGAMRIEDVPVPGPGQACVRMPMAR
jgi:hypothetical protein